MCLKTLCKKYKMTVIDCNCGNAFDFIFVFSVLFLLMGVLMLIMEYCQYVPLGKKRKSLFF